VACRAREYRPFGDFRSRLGFIAKEIKREQWLHKDDGVAVPAAGPGRARPAIFRGEERKWSEEQ